MEARYAWTAAAVVSACASLGAAHRTQNFTCNAASREVAVQVCEAAERYRRDLAVEWLGRDLPNWGKPCPITVQVGPRLGAGGATSFVFDQGEVFGWEMSIQGSLERVLDSVLPHEVTHTIFATHFRRPLPRWADEGGSTTVEHASERNKQQRMLIEFLQTGRGISFSQMFAMKEYPQDVLPLYAQGHSLASYLIYQGGKRKFVQFVGDGMNSDDWAGELQRFYGIRNLGALQNTWLDWVAQGSPALGSPETTALASAESPLPGPYALDSSAPQTSVVAAEPLEAAVAVAAPPAAIDDGWTGKRPRPQPNLVHHDSDRSPSPASMSGAAGPIRPVPVAGGELVPIDFSAPAPSDPFAVPTRTPDVPAPSSVSRPQHPETPRQIILQWSKSPDAPVTANRVEPLLDASAGETIRR